MDEVKSLKPDDGEPESASSSDAGVLSEASSDEYGKDEQRLEAEAQEDRRTEAEAAKRRRHENSEQGEAVKSILRPLLSGTKSNNDGTNALPKADRSDEIPQTRRWGARVGLIF